MERREKGEEIQGVVSLPPPPSHWGSLSSDFVLPMVRKKEKGGREGFEPLSPAKKKGRESSFQKGATTEPLGFPDSYKDALSLSLPFSLFLFVPHSQFSIPLSLNHSVILFLVSSLGNNKCMRMYHRNQKKTDGRDTLLFDAIATTFAYFYTCSLSWPFKNKHSPYCKTLKYREGFM